MAASRSGRLYLWVTSGSDSASVHRSEGRSSRKRVQKPPFHVVWRGSFLSDAFPRVSAGATARRDIHAGGAYIGIGALMWLLHSLLMIVGAGIVTTSPSVASGDVATASLLSLSVVYVLALGLVVLAASLVALGIYLLWRGIATASRDDPLVDSSPAVLADVTYRVTTAVAMFGAYGFLAGITLMLLLAGPPAAAVAAILFLWPASSLFLLVAVFRFDGFLEKARDRVRIPKKVGGMGLIVYAIFNLIGTWLFCGSFIMILVASVAAARTYVPFLGAGAFWELAFVPLCGAVVFGILCVYGSWLGHVEPLSGWPPSA